MVFNQVLREPSNGYAPEQKRCKRQLKAGIGLQDNHFIHKLDSLLSMWRLTSNDDIKASHETPRHKLMLSVEIHLKLASTEMPSATGFINITRPSQPPETHNLRMASF